MNPRTFFTELKRRRVYSVAVAYVVVGWLLIQVATQVLETDRALAALEKILSIPGNGGLATGMPLTPALLRLDPMFDPLRSDPRFQKLCHEKHP